MALHDYATHVHRLHDHAVRKLHDQAVHGLHRTFGPEMTKRLTSACAVMWAWLGILSGILTHLL